MRWTEWRGNCRFLGSWLSTVLVIAAVAMAGYAQQAPANDAGSAPAGQTTSGPATSSSNTGSQGGAATRLPDAPSAQQPPASSDSAQQSPSTVPKEGQQTKRILGIIPNFRAVSVDTRLPPQTPKEKFVGFAQDSFDYSSFIWIGVLSGVSQLNNSTKEFGQGAAGYGRYYWHSFADQTNENLWVEFLLPVATREDPRYYTLGSQTVSGHNGPFKRAGYAVSRLFVTRTDSGGSSFNFSEVGGAGAAAAISNLYYPGPERTFTKTYQRWFLNAGLDAMTNVFREFWPDINRAIFHGKYSK